MTTQTEAYPEESPGTREVYELRTNIDLDEELVKEAFRYADVATKKDLVHLALRELIARHRRMDLQELWGTGGIRPDYDYKRLRTEEK